MTANPTRLQAAVRSLSVLIAFEIMMDFVSPAMWVLSERASVLSNVARLSSSVTLIAVTWFVAALMLLPFVVMQLFMHDCTHRRRIIKLAILGLCIGAAEWFFMAFLVRNLDYSFAKWNFLFNCGGALAMACLMASGLNNDQIEQHLDSQKGAL